MRKAAYTVGEFIRDHGIGRTKFYELVNAGELRARRVGGRTIVTAEDAKAWLDNLPAVQPKAISSFARTSHADP